jgi:hypothetical protein
MFSAPHSRWAPKAPSHWRHLSGRRASHVAGPAEIVQGVSAESLIVPRPELRIYRWAGRYGFRDRSVQQRSSDSGLQRYPSGLLSDFFAVRQFYGRRLWFGGNRPHTSHTNAQAIALWTGNAGQTVHFTITLTGPIIGHFGIRASIPSLVAARSGCRAACRRSAKRARVWVKSRSAVCPGCPRK